MGQAEDPQIRKSVTMPESMWAAAERFRLRERLGSETEAVRQLILTALRSEGLIDEQDRNS